MFAEYAVIGFLIIKAKELSAVQTTDRSATAADKLAKVTAQYNLAAALHFDYLKVIRAINNLSEHLEELEGDKSAVMAWMKTCRDFADLKRSELEAYCVKKQSRMAELTALMQNGAYDRD